MPYLPKAWAEALHSGSVSSLLALDENIPKKLAGGYGRPFSVAIT
jgi:hypothetical protein